MDESVLFIENEESEIQNVTFYNLTGEQFILPGTEANAWDMRSLSSGIYILDIRTKTKTYKYKIVKK